jgi:hypothetical protein
MAKNKTQHVLGVMVSEDALHAVLVAKSEDDTRVEAHFSRVRGADYTSDAGLPDDATSPEFEDEASGDDFTIQFGEGGDDNTMFLGSEFGEMEGGGQASPAAMAAQANFDVELEEILSEVEARGYDDPAVVFCTAASEIDELELQLPAEEGTNGNEGPLGRSLPVKRKKLLGMIEEQYDGAADDERVAFVPLTPAEDGRQRVLSLIGKPNGPVFRTMEAVRDSKSSMQPQVRGLDTEISLYVGLARAALQLPPGSLKKTLVVRASMTDTLALFMDGNTLEQAETLRSLTARDAAETICSRVLLLQDEYGIGDVQNVLLIGEKGEETLIEDFEMFFPDANVESLRSYLPQTEDEEPLTGAYVAAIGAALRAIDHPDFQDAFWDINLLPKSLLKRGFKIPFGWTVPALYALIFITALGFTFYYSYNAGTIGELRTELEHYRSRAAEMDERELQARIDSLNGITERYITGLEVLDNLLQGSNKWSKALADVSRQTASVEGIWVDQWNPQRQDLFMVTGNATARNRIVSLAERLDGNINRVTFSEIREWPVYSFEMTVPLDMELPAAAKYLREQMAMTAQNDAPQDDSAETPASTVALDDTQ